MGEQLLFAVSGGVSKALDAVPKFVTKNGRGEAGVQEGR